MGEKETGGGGREKPRKYFVNKNDKPKMEFKLQKLVNVFFFFSAKKA